MRVRFAPSPTGALHLGNARTALVNWLHARSRGGTLVLRIEDTDAGRNTPAAEAALLEDLRWLGLDWDEGPDVGGPHAPYRQSERADRYRQLGERLQSEGRAYPCFCAPEQLRAAREAARAAGEDWRYPGTCRALSVEGASRRRGAGEAAALRYRAAEDSSWPSFHDGLRGETGAGGGSVEDFVLVRADGVPVYQFAVVADDHDMAIDHVIRGQDHLSNTPRQLLLYEALGWTPPRFTHVPLVLGADRSRLSKRHGATSVGEMRRAGILPEALTNYLALLGWAPPEEREVLTPEELLAAWRLDALSSTNVAFDRDKLAWIDQQHLLALPVSELVTRAEPWLRVAGLDPATEGARGAWWGEAVDLVRGQAGGLAGLARELQPIFEPAPSEPVTDPDERRLLEALATAAEEGELDTAEGFGAAARSAGGAIGLRGRALFHPIRLALTGHDSGPELARLAPLIARGAQLDLHPPVMGAAERFRNAVAPS